MYYFDLNLKNKEQKLKVKNGIAIDRIYFVCSR